MVLEIIAAIKSLGQLAKLMESLISEIRNLRSESIQKELQGIKSDVAETIKRIETASTKEERTRLARELNERMSR